MSMGSPDITVTIPETCQLASSQFAAGELAAKCGCSTSHVKAAVKRCGRSKSETPRLLRGSSWLPRMLAVSKAELLSMMLVDPAPPPVPVASSIDLENV